jgi:hypothetical protein
MVNIILRELSDVAVIAGRLDIHDENLVAVLADLALFRGERQNRVIPFSDRR